MIEAICSCGERYQVKDGYAGKRVRCLACSGPIAVPAKRTIHERRLARSPTVASAPVGVATTAAPPRNRLASAGAVDPALQARRSPARPLATVSPRAEGAPAPARRAASRREAVLDWSIVVGATIGYVLIGALWFVL